jgi:hypothetical protein
VVKRVSIRIEHVLFLALAIAGCNDDRKKVQADIFFCNPASKSADVDCGDGYVCYTASQAVGASICVPKCDPANEAKTCPQGRCTRAGECLTGCRVEDKDSCPAGNHVTSCVRTTYSPVEAATGNDGVCLPIAFSCATSDDCLGSPVFNVCTSETNGQDSDSTTLLRSGSVCAQGNCNRDGVACEPGSTCIKSVFGAGSEGVPDVCTPNCLYQKDPQGTKIFQCTVGFTCMNMTFPQTSARVCMPGYPGWRCADSLGCAAGTCEKRDDLGKPYDELYLCTPACKEDSDCRPYDTSPPGMPPNPTFYSRFICVNKRCHNLGSVFLTDACIEGGSCALDSEAKCMVGMGPTSGAMCVHRCVQDQECDSLSTATHVQHSCDQRFGMCFPSLPFLSSCTDDSGCIEGLKCLDNSILGGLKTCTLACATTDDCAAHAALGSNFFCSPQERICVPKQPAGSPAPSPFCLSGQSPSGICQSPSGWGCDADGECLSGKCDNLHCK